MISTERSYLTDAETKGKIEGQIAGRMEGRMEGKIEGIMEAKIEIAKKLLSNGVSIDLVPKTTGLSEDEIHKIL